MANLLQDYAGQAQLTKNSRPLLEPTKISVKRASNAAKVKTIAKGLSGRTRGGPEYSISIDNPIPANGYESDWNELVDSQDIFELGVEIANQTEIFEGWLESSDTDSAVDQAVTQSVQFHGRLKQRQTT